MSKLQVNEVEHPSSGSLLTLRKPARPDDATTPTELVRLSQMQSYAAPAAGNAAQPFAVAVPTDPTHALRLGHLGTAGASIFAALEGLASQTFSVASATADAHAVRRGDSNTRPGYTYIDNDWCWIDRPRGLRLQWGRTGSISNGGSATITFPTAFSSACFFVIGNQVTSGNSTVDNQMQVTAMTTTTFTVHSNESGGVAGSMSYLWVALGV